MQFQGPQGQVHLFFGNKSQQALERLICNVPPAQQFQFQLAPLPQRIDAKKQIQVSCLMYAVMGTFIVMEKLVQSW